MSEVTLFFILGKEQERADRLNEANDYVSIPQTQEQVNEQAFFVLQNCLLLLLKFSKNCLLCTIFFLYFQSLFSKKS